MEILAFRISAEMTRYVRQLLQDHVSQPPEIRTLCFYQYREPWDRHCRHDLGHPGLSI